MFQPFSNHLHGSMDKEKYSTGHYDIDVQLQNLEKQKIKLHKND
jgi:hypothetical protein